MVQKFKPRTLRVVLATQEHPPTRSELRWAQGEGSRHDPRVLQSQSRTQFGSVTAAQ